ncbi:hypothetical protein RDI58_013599 [Solanum bulbocastanum]|uniref:Ubiquitin-like protease family profile domain-containing protein n=1 Tax=Solanum bulbocastanum TaxID=147425 RepID=A0AAN8TN56_SOLBU
MFKDVLFMEEEIVVIEVEKLNNLNHSAFKMKSKHGSFARQSDNVQAHNDEMDNDKEVPHNSAHHAESDLSSTISKDLVKFAQDIDKVRNDLGILERNINDKFNEMKTFMDSSFKHIIEELKSIQQEGSTNKGGVPVDFVINRNTHTLNDFVMPNMHEPQLVALETGQTYVSSLVDVEYENICVTPLEVVEAGKTKFNQFGVGEGENTHHVRTKIPGKYAQSPYTNLSESSGTSVNTMKYCSWRHPFVNYKGFDMCSEVILHFKKWVDSKLYKKRGKKTSFFTAASNPIDPPFEYGVGRVKLMDWKDIDWNTDVHYASRLVGDMLVYGNSENVPQQRDNSIDCGLYTCAFAEYVCRGDRDISMSVFNSENLRLRFGALLWKYGKMKIDTESVSKDETSKQGGLSNRRVKE